MNTLEDLRPTIADILEGVAEHRIEAARRGDRGDLHGEPARWHRARRGAATLRWCAEYEAPSIEDLRVALAAADEALEEVTGNRDDLIDNVCFAVSKWEHGDECPPGQLEARGDAVCDCMLNERRKSVLDAVA